jgi:predicted metalloprotease with PDZ domain
MSDPASHEFELEMRVPAHADRPAIELAFPAWAPGSYMIRDFARHVYQLKVSAEDGRTLESTRLDKQRWRVESGGGAFVVRYRVFAFEATVRTAFLDDSHAYWNGTSLFFLVDGEAARPCRLDIVAPAGWRIATALPPTTSPAARGVGRRGGGGRPAQSFWAHDFDDLVDAPVEIGTHEWHSFRVDGCDFELALYGRTNADSGRLVQILRQVVTATGKIFGGFPFARYLFIVHALPVATGGLEHRASVTMDIAGLSFDEELGYVRFADLAAHEFFHAWNVKRLHDPVLGPFDYGRECYTRLLWFHEGFTDYLANVIILRAGVIDAEAFWRWISTDWPRYANRPGRRETPLAELSFEAWIKQYKPADNHINRAVSYYEKGLWVGMALDLELRLASGGRRGLPELFRQLWNQAGRREAAVTETDVRAAARAVGGRSFDAFFDRYIHGTEDVPLPRLWRRSGLEVRLLRPWDAAAGETDITRRRRARSWIGVAVQGSGYPGGSERAIIKNVLPDSPAARAGLTFGDEIVAVNADRVTAASVGRRLADHAPGARTVITYFRRERLHTASITIGTSPERKLDLKPAPSASRAATAVRRGWLGVAVD